MSMNFNKTKILVLLAVFILFGFGRWVNLAVVHDWAAGSAVMMGIIYGLLVGLIAYFLTDLVLVKGLLQFKILFIKTIFLTIVILSFFNYFLFRDYPNLIKEIAAVEVIIVIIFFINVLKMDSKKKHIDHFLFSEKNTLPAKYLRPHPLKTLLETLFRLFPYPEPVALYKIGKPSKKSPVFVTGNYDLTIRRVVAALKSLDCWLLVCDSRGINIWCSSLANHFKTDDINKAIKLTNLSKKVNHKKIILPQLCAGNIFPGQIKKETGFNSRFGPVSIKNISAYLEDRRNQDIRKVTFTLKERLEMALGCPLICCGLLFFVYNFIDLSNLLVVIPIVFILTIIHAVVFPGRMIKSILPWSLFVGSISFFIIYGLFSAGMGFISPGNCLAIGISMIYLVNEFTGWSPLLKYSLIPYEKAHITVDQDLCIGCYRCIEVCPKAVYEFKLGTSKAVNLDECVLCKSCFRQCPSGAINHSANKS